MSLILEALRKSEAERRRGEVPSVYSDLPPAARAMRPRVPATASWIAASVVMVAIVIGAGVMYRQATPRVVATHMPVARHRTTRALPPVPHLTPAPVVVAPKIAKTPSPASVQQQVTATPVANRPIALPPPSPPPAAAAPRDDAMRLSDLDPEQRKALPPLKLSMHMWNDDPAQRFVILDGNRLREGDRIGDAVVTAITVDGVVLDWNGRKLKLPIR